MIEGTATIKVPVKYEEIFVHGKKFDSRVNSLDNILPSLNGIVAKNKDKEKEQTDGEEERISKKKAALKGELVYLPNGKTEQVLPLFGEEIIRRKKMKQIREAVITKRNVTENKRISLDVKGKKVIVRYRDGTERTLEPTAFSQD